MEIVNAFIEDLEKMVDKYRDISQLTYSDAIAGLEIVKAAIIKEMQEEEASNGGSGGN